MAGGAAKEEPTAVRPDEASQVPDQGAWGGAKGGNKDGEIMEVDELVLKFRGARKSVWPNALEATDWKMLREGARQHP